MSKIFLIFFSRRAFYFNYLFDYQLVNGKIFLIFCWNKYR